MNIKRILAFGCCHHPMMHQGFLKWKLAQIEAFRPDFVVNLGDWHDAEYASRWENECEWTALDEFKLLRDHALSIKAAAPNAKVIWLYGNHDDNPLQPGRVNAKVRSAVEFAKEQVLKDAISDWRIIPYGHDKYYRLGQITFQHGCQTNLNAERDQCLLYGVPYGLHVSAHTHRPKPVTRVELPGKIPCYGAHFCNVGTGADWSKMRYIQRANHELWGRAIVKIEANVNSGRSWYGSKQWDAELVIHSMKSDRA